MLLKKKIHQNVFSLEHITPNQRKAANLNETTIPNIVQNNASFANSILPIWKPLESEFAVAPILAILLRLQLTTFLGESLIGYKKSFY